VPDYRDVVRSDEAQKNKILSEFLKIMQIYPIVSPEIDKFFLQNWGISSLFPKKISSKRILY
jgi:hypothetical protein